MPLSLPTIDSHIAARADVDDLTASEDAAARGAAAGRAPTEDAATAAWLAELSNRPEMRSELERSLIGMLGAAGDIAAVSPQMLLALLQNRMRDLDGQVSTIMNGLNERTQEAERISQDLSQLRSVQTVLNGRADDDGNIEMDGAGMSQDQFYELCRAAGVDADDAQAMWAEHATPGEPGVINMATAVDVVLPVEPGERPMSERLSSRGGIDNEIDNRNLALQDANRGTELVMIKLNTLMDQRKQQLELTSNMLNVMSDTLDRIGGNIS